MPRSEMGTLGIFTDGAARGNPGPAGVGALLLDENGKVVAEISRFIGIATNNVAEYLAVIYALQEAVCMGAKDVKLSLDSQLVERQIKGEYRVKNMELKRFFDLALNLVKRFDKLTIVGIPRSENKRADKLANDAIDQNYLT